MKARMGKRRELMSGSGWKREKTSRLMWLKKWFDWFSLDSVAFQRFSILKKGVRRETEFGKGLGEERGERRTKSEGQKRSTIVKEARNHRHEIPRIGLCLKAMSEEREGVLPNSSFYSRLCCNRERQARERARISKKYCLWTPISKVGEVWYA